MGAEYDVNIPYFHLNSAQTLRTWWQWAVQEWHKMGPWSIVSFDHQIIVCFKLAGTVSLIFSQISVCLCIKLMSKWIRTEPTKQRIRNDRLSGLGELTNSRPTAEKPAWDWTSPPAPPCGLQLYSLVCLRGPWVWDQDLSLEHQLAFWSPFSTVECLAQPWCSRQGPGLALTYSARFFWLPMGGHTLSEEWMRGGLGRKQKGGGAGGGEGGGTVFGM